VEPLPDGRLRDYAQLAIKVGVNLQPGQRLAINAQVEHHPFVRAAAEAAYEAGASYVDVYYADDLVRRAHIEHVPETELGWSPPWLIERVDSLREDGGAVLSITGSPNPTIFSDLDPERVARSRMHDLRVATLRLSDGLVNWSIVAYPTAGWAQTVFGTTDVDRLWDAVATAVRLDEADPVAAWVAHIARLERRAEILNDRAFDSIRYAGPGTDFRVGLHSDSIWQAANDVSRGIRHVPNMPTEEVFTTPDARRADGVVRATYPLLLQGTIVRGLEVRFENGRVTDVRAEEGEALVRAHVAVDDGAARLGEIALVDGESRVGQTGIVFYDTLFDENAASHIAFGAAIVQAVDAGGLSPEERHARGVNNSSIHTDFMIGSGELDVFGVSGDGGETPILRHGAWVLTE
jgi:aminopeptidase